MRKFITALLAVTVTAATGLAHATSWYVDAAVATPGNGQSWATAFQSFASVTWSSLRPGDTLYVSGGPSGGSKSYTQPWSVGASGTASAPIRIALEAANPSHNGIANFDFDAYGDRATVNGITVANRSYVVFSGNVEGQSHFVVKNLRNIVERTSATCFGGSGNTSITVEYVEFVNCNNGVRLSSGFQGTGSNVRNSAFRQIRGDVAVMLDMGGTTWDAHSISGNTIEMLFNTAVPTGGSGAYVGPDGIQPGNGVSIHGNTIRVSKTSAYTSNQHPDGVQFGMSRYLKIYNNEFVNVGDSAIDLGVWGTNVNVSDIWIFNNVFRIETAIDPYPQFIRLYANPGNIASITNLKIVNNLFLDGAPGWPVIDMNAYGGSPTAAGVEIRNNIFYGTAGMRIAASSQFSATSFGFSNNVYYPSTGTSIVFNGTTRTPAAWQLAMEPTARLSAPSFVNYVANSSSNNLHLSPNDSVARNAGIALNTLFGFDKDGISRPQDALWDIGPYEYAGGVPTLNPPTGLKVQ